MLGRQLGHSVWRNGVQGNVLGARVRGCVTVDTGRRGEHESGRSGENTRFEQMLSDEDVVPDIGWENVTQEPVTPGCAARCTTQLTRLSTGTGP